MLNFPLLKMSWHSPESNFTASALGTILCNEFENYTFEITVNFSIEAIGLILRPVTQSFHVFFDLRLNKRVNNREAGDLRRYRLHYDVIVMINKIVTRWNVGALTWYTESFRVSYFSHKNREAMNLAANWYQFLQYTHLLTILKLALKCA